MLQQGRRMLIPSGVLDKFLQSFRPHNIQKFLPFIDQVCTIHLLHPSFPNADNSLKTQSKNTETSEFSHSVQNWCLQRPFSSRPSQKNSNKKGTEEKASALMWQVINQREWCDETETELDSLNIKLSSPAVLSVLYNLEKDPEKALNFFKWAAAQSDFSHTSSTYNAVIRILGRESYIQEFWNLVEEMDNEGYQMHMKTYVKVLRKFLKSGRMEDAVVSFVLMMCNPTEEDRPSSQNCSTILLHLSSFRNPNIDLVHRVVKGFRKGNGCFTKAVYDGIHRCMVNAGRFEEAEGVVKDMVKEGFVPDNVTYSQLVFGFCKVGRLDEACRVLDGMKGQGCDPDLKTWTILIEGYCKAGNVERAMSCFESMLESGCEADGEVLAVLVNGFCDQDRIEDAYSFLCEMIEEKSLKPTQATFKKLLQELAHKDKLRNALKLVGLMKDQGFPPFADPFHELFAKCGTVDEALHFLNKLRKKRAPSVRTYVSMLDAFCKAGRQAEARFLLGKCPDHIRKTPDVSTLLGSKDGLSPAPTT